MPDADWMALARMGDGLTGDSYGQWDVANGARAASLPEKTQAIPAADLGTAQKPQKEFVG